MADSTKALLFVGAGAAVWYFYFRTPSATSTSGTSTAPAGSTSGSTPPTKVPSQPTAPSLDTLYGQLVTAAGAAKVRDPDNYNAILTQIYPAAGPLPDPLSLFGDTAWSRPMDMPIASYWSRTAVWLKANKGLSGIGRYGLGAVATLAGMGRI